jgi:hypothetical protein
MGGVLDNIYANKHTRGTNVCSIAIASAETMDVSIKI